MNTRSVLPNVTRRQDSMILQDLYFIEIDKFGRLQATLLTIWVI